jgi:NitT/TauT family transport system substrate-binding protein
MANKTILWVENNPEGIPPTRRILRNNNFFILILIGMTLLALAACKNKPSPPMRIGMNVWPGYEPLFLARKAGALNEKDFRLVEFSNGSEVGRAFRNGILEATCLTLDEVFYTIQDGMDPVILLVLDESCGADVVLARPEIKNLAGLKGKRIAVEVSAVGAYMLTRTLKQAGLTIKDVTPVYLPIEKHFSAYNDGLVDAVVTFEPVRTRLLSLGTVDLFNSSMIPGEIVDVLVVRRDYLESHPERIEALRKAWFAALEQMRRSPHESARFMAVRERVTTEEFESSLRGLRLPNEQENNELLDLPSPKLLITAEQLKTVMKESGLLQSDISIKALFVLPETIKAVP